MMLLAAMLLIACSKDDEAKAATVQEAGKTQAELKQILKAGQGNITVTLSLSNTTGINSVRSDAESGVYYSLNGQQVEKPTKGIYIRNGKKVIL